MRGEGERESDAVPVDVNRSGPTSAEAKRDEVRSVFPEETKRDKRKKKKEKATEITDREELKKKKRKKKIN